MQWKTKLTTYPGREEFNVHCPNRSYSIKSWISNQAKQYSRLWLCTRDVFIPWFVALWSVSTVAANLKPPPPLSQDNSFWHLSSRVLFCVIFSLIKIIKYFYYFLIKGLIWLLLSPFFISILMMCDEFEYILSNS